MGSFALQIGAFAEKAKGNADLVVRKVVIDLASSVVKRSPVGNPTLWKNPPPPGYVGGRFRANWTLQEGAIDYTTTQEVDPSGAASIQRVAARISDKATGRVWFLSNSLPYANALEYGHSTQAPSGMARLAVAEFQTFVDRAVAELPK